MKPEHDAPPVPDLCEMSEEDGYLLDCLICVVMQQPLPEGSDDLVRRMIDCGLMEAVGEQLALTHAGIERCQSLKLRRSSDIEAGKVVAQRLEDDLSA